MITANEHDHAAFSSSLPAGLHTAPQIADWLQSLGAPHTSYVIADDADLDGKTLPTDRGPEGSHHGG